MSYRSIPMRQIVDWRAAIRASVIAGLSFLLLNLVLTNFAFGTNIWVFMRLLASLVLNKTVLAPPATFDALVLLVALLTHFGLSIAFGLFIAYVVHRGGLLTGVIGGAILGLAFYSINFYTMTLFFPWFFALNTWIMVLTHMIFGALAGGIYEALEVELFVPEERNL